MNPLRVSAFTERTAVAGPSRSRPIPTAGGRATRSQPGDHLSPPSDLHLFTAGNGVQRLRQPPSRFPDVCPSRSSHSYSSRWKLSPPRAPRTQRGGSFSSSPSGKRPKGDPSLVTAADGGPGTHPERSQLVLDGDDGFGELSLLRLAIQEFLEQPRGPYFPLFHRITFPGLSGQTREQKGTDSCGGSFDVP
jgi:hypothetical protein